MTKYRVKIFSDSDYTQIAKQVENFINNLDSRSCGDAANRIVWLTSPVPAAGMGHIPYTLYTAVVTYFGE